MRKILSLLFSTIFYSSTYAVTYALPTGLLARSGLDPEFVARFALFAGILLVWTTLFSKIVQKIFRLPTIAGQIVAGIALGPSLIHIAGLSFFARPIQLVDAAAGSVYTIVSSDLYVFFILLLSAVLTVSYLMWIAGHETDVHDIWHIGQTAVSAGLLGAFIPILCTILVLHYSFASDWSLIASVGLGLIFSATSVSIPVAMLFASKKMHLKSSKATLGAAVVDDVVAVILLSLFFIAVSSGLFGPVGCSLLDHHCTNIWVACGAMAGTLVAMILGGFFIMAPAMRWLKKMHYSYLIAPLATSIMLFYFAGSELIGGLAGITGAYFAGLFHRMGDANHTAEKTFSPFVNAVLLPLFLGSIGLQLDISILSAWQWVLVVVLLIVAIISKLFACYVAIGLSNFFSNRASYRWTMLDGYLFGSSMVARGEVGLVIATILFTADIISPDQYTIAVVVIILTTIAAPIMLAIGFAQLDLTEKMKMKDKEYILNIGLFNVIGTVQMFDVILRRVEAMGECQTSIQFSDGRKIVNIEGQDVKIILCPDEGILFEGDQQRIHDILHYAQQSIKQDLGRLLVDNHEV